MQQLQLSLAFTCLCISRKRNQFQLACYLYGWFSSQKREMQISYTNNSNVLHPVNFSYIEKPEHKVDVDIMYVFMYSTFGIGTVGADKIQSICI